MQDASRSTSKESTQHRPSLTDPCRVNVESIRSLPSPRGQLWNPDGTPTELAAEISALYGCSKNFLSQLRHSSEELHLGPNEVVLKAGQECQDLFVVEQGSLTYTIDGQEMKMITIGSSVNTLGFLGLYTRQPEADLCAANTGCILLRIRHEDFKSTCSRFHLDRQAIKQNKAEMASKHAVLSGIEVLQLCEEQDPGFLWALMEEMPCRRFVKGDRILEQGGEGLEMYVLESGSAVLEIKVPHIVTTKKEKEKEKKEEVAMESGDGDGTQLPADRETSTAKKQNERSNEDFLPIGGLSAGSCFGEIAIFGMSCRSTTVRITSPSTVLELSKEYIEDVLKLFPKVKASYDRKYDVLGRAYLESLSCDVSLSSLSVFKACDSQFLNHLQESTERRTVLPDRVVIQEGSAGDALYILLQGRCVIEIGGRNVGYVRQGGCFGLVTLLKLTSKHANTVRTETLTILLVLPRDSFDRALNQFPACKPQFDALAQVRLIQNRDGPRKIAFFNDCSAEFTQNIRSHLTQSLFMPDQVIVAEGAPGSSMFILSHGQAHTEKKGSANGELEAGDFFGELVLLGISSNYSMTVKATSTCIVDELHGHSFQAALRKFPEDHPNFEELARSHLSNSNELSVYSWPFFKDCPSRFLYLLDINLQRRVFFGSQHIVEVTEEDMTKEHSCALSMFVLIKGKASVVHEDIGEIRILQNNDVYGEMAVLGIPNEMGKVLVAQTLCDVRILCKSVVDQAFAEFPEEWPRFRSRLSQCVDDLEVVERGESCSNSLRHIDFLSDASLGLVEYIHSRMLMSVFLPGHFIIESAPKKTLTHMFVLRRGKAVSTKEGEVIANHTAPSYFGETALLGIAAAPAAVCAKTPCVVQLLCREDLEAGLERFPNERQRMEDHLHQLAEKHNGPDIRRIVQETPLFANSDPTFVEALCEHVKQRSFNPGDLIVDENDPATHEVILFISGRASVSVNDVVTGEVSAGDLAIFGDVAGLGIGCWRPTTVRCISSPCKVIELCRPVLAKALESASDERKKLRSVSQKRLWNDASNFQNHLSWIKSTCAEISKKVSFLRTCSQSFIYSLVKSYVREAVHPRGSVLAEERSNDVSLIVLLDGVAEVIVDGIVLGKLKGGAVFGEESLLGFPRRTASLHANTACRVLVVPAAEMWNLLSSSEYEVDCCFFQELRKMRQDTAERLCTLPTFLDCDPLCVQQVALLAERMELPRGSVWMPGIDVEHQGEALAVILAGHASVELEDLEVLPLSLGGTIAEGLVHKHGGALRAMANCSICRVRRHDLFAAVLQFPQSQTWFDNFRKERNKEYLGLKKMLTSKRAQAKAVVPHAKDADVRLWFRRSEHMRRFGREKSKAYSPF